MGSVASVVSNDNKNKVNIEQLISKDKTFSILLFRSNREIQNQFFNFLERGEWVDKLNMISYHNTLTQLDPVKSISCNYIIPQDSKGSRRSLFVKTKWQDLCKNKSSSSYRNSIENVLSQGNIMQSALICLVIPIFLCSKEATIHLSQTPLAGTLAKVRADSDRSTAGTESIHSISSRRSSSISTAVELAAEFVADKSASCIYPILELRESISNSNSQENPSIDIRPQESSVHETSTCRKSQAVSSSSSAAQFLRCDFALELAQLPDMESIVRSGTWIRNLADFYEDPMMLPISIVSYNSAHHETKLAYVNPSYAVMSGYDKDELIGMEYQHLFASTHSEQSQLDKIHWAISTGKSIKLGVSCSRKKIGSHFINLVAIAPVFDIYGAHCFSVMVHYDLDNYGYDAHNLSCVDTVMQLLVKTLSY